MAQWHFNVAQLTDQLGRRLEVGSKFCRLRLELCLTVTEPKPTVARTAPRKYLTLPTPFLNRVMQMLGGDRVCIHHLLI